MRKKFWCGKKDGNIDRDWAKFLVLWLFTTRPRDFGMSINIYTQTFFFFCLASGKEEVLRYFYRLDGLGQGIGGSPSRYYGT